MDDALLVRGLEGLGNLLRDERGLRERGRPARDDLQQVLALDQFHHEGVDVRRAVRGLDHAVDLRDVRVVQRGKRLRFAGEIVRHDSWIVGNRFGQDSRWRPTRS